MDESIDQTVVRGEDAEPRRVRRRRSSRRSRRSGRPQASLPFTRLRFTRLRLPTLSQASRLIIAVAALGVAGWAIRAANLAGAMLDQSQAQLAMNTRGATIGRLAADRLAAQAQADTAQMMVQQEMARRQAASVPSGLAPAAPYLRGFQQDQTESSAGATSTSYGAAPYGALPYGAAIYGNRPTDTGSPGSAGGVMGYTLPQKTAPP